MTDDELRDLAARALTFPSLDAEPAFGVLTDALLERGLIPEYKPPRKARRKRERAAAERHYRWHAFSWARQTWPLVEEHYRFTEWWHTGTDGYVETSSLFGVERAVDASRLWAQALNIRTPAQMLGDIRDLYANQIIDRSHAISMLNTAMRPTIIETNSPSSIQVCTNPMMPREQFYLVSPSERIRMLDIGADWASEKESPPRDGG